MEYNIENEEGILIQEKGRYCSKLKKKNRNLKTKKLLKIIILDYKKKPSIQSADTTKGSSASLKLRKHVFTKAWKVAVTASISQNK